MKKLSQVLIILMGLIISSGFALKIKPPKLNGKSQNEKKKEWSDTDLTVHKELEIWKESYPDVKFELGYDAEISDWKITVENYGKSKVYYWANGLYLPKSELENKDKYWRVITRYQNRVLDPDNFTEEQLAKIREFGSNRKEGKVSSKAIFNAIYDSQTRGSTERHIKQIQFLGKYSNVHEYLKEPLSRVEKRILELEKTDPQVKKFIDELLSCQAYNWREIRDVNTRSFHSYGIAIDILPQGWGKKIVYWGFEKNGGNKDWMLIPLSKRWMPPQSVIDAFYDEGFIWGGTWAVWDNMHFEYHPELIWTSKN